MSQLVCHKLKIWIGKYKADISEPTCGSSSALSRHSQELLGIHGHGKEGTVTVSRLCRGVVQLVRTPACHAGGRLFESRRSRQFFEAAPFLVNTLLVRTSFFCIDRGVARY